MCRLSGLRSEHSTSSAVKVWSTHSLALLAMAEFCLGSEVGRIVIFFDSRRRRREGTEERTALANSSSACFLYCSSVAASIGAIACECGAKETVTATDSETAKVDLPPFAPPRSYFEGGGSCTPVRR